MEIVSQEEITRKIISLVMHYCWQCLPRSQNWCCWKFSSYRQWKMLGGCVNSEPKNVCVELKVMVSKMVMLQSHGTNGAWNQLWIKLLEKTSSVALWLEMWMVVIPGICLPLALACPLGLLAHVKVQLVQPWLNTVQDYCLSIPKHTDWQKLAAVIFKATNSCSSDQGWV